MSRYSILVVDDEPIVLQVLHYALARENYEVIAAKSAPEAIEICEKRADAIDLAILDGRFDEMRGQELAKRLRTRWPALRVILSSGFPSGTITLDDSMTFLPKPFTANVLRAAVRSEFGRPR